VTAVPAALVSVALTALVALAGYAGGGVLTIAVALTVIVVAIGWAVLLALPDPRGTAAVIALTGFAALAVADLGRSPGRPLAIFAAVVAFAVLAAFTHELLRRDGRPRLVESVTGTLSGQVVALLGAGWVLLPDAAAGVAAVAVAAAAAGMARMVAVVPFPQRVAGWAEMAAGAAAGAGTAVALTPDLLQTGVAVAVVVAAMVAGIDRLLVTVPGSGSRLGTLSAGAAPVAAVGMVAYAVIRLLAG
jgi:hypothetical protein